MDVSEIASSHWISSEKKMLANAVRSVAVPCIIVASVNAKIRWDAHWEHVAHEEHEHPRSERPEYPYQNLRTKNYFWGDGDKVWPIVHITRISTSSDTQPDPLLERQGQLPQEGRVSAYIAYL